MKRELKYTAYRNESLTLDELSQFISDAEELRFRYVRPYVVLKDDMYDHPTKTGGGHIKSIRVQS